MSRSPAWNIAVGRWWFRHRNTVFPIVFALIAIFLRPHVLFGRPRLDHLLMVSGAALALLGQAIRLITIGFEYIDRGGKNRQVSATRLVQGGVYAHTRNPMYLGNFLIAVGMSMVTGAPAAYLIVIPLFAFIYQAIIATEEDYLRQKFGAEYAAYCRRVPRLLPSLRGLRQTLSGMRYDWRRAVRKDLGTITGLLLGLICLPIWRQFFLNGLETAKTMVPVVLGQAAVVLALYVILHSLKKHRLFLYLPNE